MIWSPGPPGQYVSCSFCGLDLPRYHNSINGDRIHLHTNACNTFWRYKWLATESAKRFWGRERGWGGHLIICRYWIYVCVDLFVECSVWTWLTPQRSWKRWSRDHSDSDLAGVGSISAIPNAREVLSLLCHERFNEDNLPAPCYDADQYQIQSSLPCGMNSHHREKEFPHLLQLVQSR